MKHFWVLLFSLPLFASPYTMDPVTWNLPQGWKLHQEFKESNQLVAGFSNDDDAYVRIYASKNSSDFTRSSEKVVSSPLGDWKVYTVHNKMPEATRSNSRFQTWFQGEVEGQHFRGVSISKRKDQAESNAELFLKNASRRSQNTLGLQRSLTGPDFTGKKYYVGFGDNLSGFMGNEVKYDIAHTHDIFTSNYGGDYIGNKFVGPGQGASKLRSRWNELSNLMTWNDMYVQYSSGHGSHTGLQFGVSYNEIRDNALAYPAKEIIIFIMACHSGGLVESFDAKKSAWENWDKYGRTLMVLASSRRSETSSTGPGTDPEEPGGPSGSAGSAFGHALWKALIGHSDGFGSAGTKDGFITLGEIIDYSTWKTKNMAGHNPVHTGNFNRELVMNRVPSRSEISQLLAGSSENLSDTKILKLIEKLNKELSIQ